MAHPRLGDLLESNGVITHEQLQHALEQQKVTKKRLGEELIDEGIITEQQFIDTLRIQLASTSSTFPLQHRILSWQQSSPGT